MAILTSYDLQGKKDSFANWISNLSPVDTIFVSTTKKEAVQNTLFQWQTDSLAAADKTNAQVETSAAISKACTPTTVHTNVTQILRKAVEVSDTADSIANWGRSKELAYQMEKAGKEIKRDLEAILLQLTCGGTATTGEVGAEGETKFQKNDDVDGTPTGAVVAGTARKTRTFGDLVATVTPDTDTGAIVRIASGAANTITEAKLFELTYNLYLAGSDANTIMFHPKHATFFSSLMEVGAARGKLIANMDTELNKYVGSVIDPLGQAFTLVPNRYMPENAVYIYNPNDWTQMVLREPQKVMLAKKGSSERYMVEMELGLRHKNPYASGILELKA